MSSARAFNFGASPAVAVPTPRHKVSVIRQQFFRMSSREETDNSVIRGFYYMVLFLDGRCCRRGFNHLFNRCNVHLISKTQLPRPGNLNSFKMAEVCLPVVRRWPPRLLSPSFTPSTSAASLKVNMSESLFNYLPPSLRMGLLSVAH